MGLNSVRFQATELLEAIEFLTESPEYTKLRLDKAETIEQFADILSDFITDLGEP